MLHDIVYNIVYMDLQRCMTSNMTLRIGTTLHMTYGLIWTYDIVYDVGKGPSSCNTDEGDRKDDPMEETNKESVEEPHALTVKVRVSGVILTASRPYIHLPSVV